MRIVVIIAVNIATWFVASAGALAKDDRSLSLNVLWHTPIMASPLGRQAKTSHGSGPNTIFDRQALSPDGRIVLLGSQMMAGSQIRALFTDPEHNPIDNVIVLDLKGARPRNLHILSKAIGGPPQLLALAADASGEWVGGSTNSYMGLASDSHRDAYLARIDADGRTIWERAYGDGGWRQIQNMVSLPTSEIVVAGEDVGKGWLARIDPDGGQVWERRFGNDKGNAIALLPGGRLALAGFDATGSSSTGDYKDHVTVWIVDGSGKILKQTLVRSAINTSRGSYFGKVGVATTGDAIYVISNWSDSFHAQPVQVSKLSIDGDLIWSTLLPDTIVSLNETVPTWRTCSPTLAVSPNSNVFVACALGGQIHLYQLKQSSGSYNVSSISLPDCTNGYPANLFLAIRSDESMILSGSRLSGSVAENCTWTGRLTEAR